MENKKEEDSVVIEFKKMGYGIYNSFNFNVLGGYEKEKFIKLDDFESFFNFKSAKSLKSNSDSSIKVDDMDYKKMYEKILTECEHINEEYNTIENVLARCIKENNSLNIECSALKEEIEKRNKEYAQVENVFAKRLDKYNLLNTEYLNLKEETERQNKEKEDFLNKCHNMEKNIEELKNSNNEKENKLKDKIKELENSNNELENKNKTIRSTMMLILKLSNLIFKQVDGSNITKSMRVWINTQMDKGVVVTPADPNKKFYSTTHYNCLDFKKGDEIEVLFEIDSFGQDMVKYNYIRKCTDL